MSEEDKLDDMITFMVVLVALAVPIIYCLLEI